MQRVLGAWIVRGFLVNLNSQLIPKKLLDGLSAFSVFYFQSSFVLSTSLLLWLMGFGEVYVRDLSVFLNGWKKRDITDQFIRRNV